VPRAACLAPAVIFRITPIYVSTYLISAPYVCMPVCIYVQVLCVVPPTVGVMSTGDELVNAWDTPVGTQVSHVYIYIYVYTYVQKYILCVMVCV
jgi:hypothetical protein